MNRIRRYALLATIVVAVGLAGWTTAPAQSEPANQQTQSKVTAEQQKQLDRLGQIEEQLRKDREAVHSAITQYGWDSDETDAAQEQLFRHRTEYRQLRRSLRAAGVPVPPALGPGGGGGRGDRWPGRGYGRRPGEGFGRGMHRCPCCGWW